MSRPFINVTDDAGNKHRVMVSKIVRWGVPQSKDRSESAKSYLRLVGDNPDVVRLSNESPAEIDALILEACGDRQPAPREPQDPVARLEAWRKKNEQPADGRMWQLESLCPIEGKVTCTVWFARCARVKKAKDVDTAVTLALAAAKEAGHG